MRRCRLPSMRRYAGLLIVLVFWGWQPTAPAADSADAPAPRFTVRLIDLVNDYRRTRGLPDLAVAEELTTIASEHSAWMADRQRLSHEGFRARFDRAQSRVCVENLGWNFRQPETQLAGWIASDAHHRNLLDPAVARVGVAVSRAYVTFFACT